jgi:group I intron endonuclease
MQGAIYQIHNIETGQAYIGQTTKNVEQRWKEHIYDAMGKGSRSKGSYLHQALKKHGIKKFVIEMVRVCENKEELDFWEKKLIEERHTLRPFGYNVALGGTGVMHGRKMSAESREKISKTLLGHPGYVFEHSEEAKEKISASLIGNKRSVGRRHSEETKKKMSDAHLGKILSESTRKKITGRPRTVCTHEKAAENTFTSGGCKICAKNRANKV